MSQVPAGWFNDPYGRFHQRYWDGEKWTEHVATDGRALVDPMGTSPVVPFATPASALSGDAAAAVAGATAGDGAADVADGTAPSPRSIAGVLDRMGEPARERARPSLRAAVAGLGGALVGVGIIAIITGDDSGRGRTIAGSLVVIALAAALRWFVPIVEARAASIGMLVVGLGFFSVAATTSGGGSGSTLTALLLTVLFLAAWVLPGFRGVNLLLAVALLSLLGLFGSLTAPDTGQVDRCNALLDAGEFDTFDAECQDISIDSSSFLPAQITDALGDQGIVYLIGSALYLAATWVLDRRGYRGTATAFAAAGLLSALVGTVLLVARFGSTAGPLFVTLVGALVCMVGSHGARRATTWWGAALLAGGTVAFIAVQVKPDSSIAIGGTVLMSGALLVMAPFVAAKIRDGRPGSPQP